MDEEIRTSRHLLGRADVEQLDEADFEERQRKVDEARKRSRQAGLPDRKRH
jgi:hypothetical protein